MPFFRRKRTGPAEGAGAARAPKFESSSSWLGSLEEESNIQIRLAGSHVSSVRAGQWQADPRMLEDILLQELGPGAYTLMPTAKGSKTFSCRVGDPAQQQTTIGQRKESEALLEMQRKLEAMKADMEKQSLTREIIAQVPQIVGALKGEQLKLGDLVSVLKATAADPVGMFREVREMMKDAQAMMPAPAPAAEPDDALSKALGQVLTEYLVPRVREAIPALAGASSVESSPDEGLATGFANPSDSASADSKKAVASAQFLVQQYLSAIDRAAQRGEPEAVAEVMIDGISNAEKINLADHPIVKGFWSDPGRGFDAIAENVPHLLGEIAESSRAAVIERVAQMTAEDDEDE